MSIIVLNIYEPMNLYIPLHPNHVKIKINKNTGQLICIIMLNFHTIS